MHLNLHDPKTRNKVLLAAAGLGLVVALLLRHRAAATTTAAVGATQDPSAGVLDPTAFGTTSGLPPGLGGGGSGVSGVAAADPATYDLSPINDAATQLGDAAQAIASAAVAFTTPADPALAAPVPGRQGETLLAPSRTPGTSKGVWWGGKFVTSIAQLSAFEKSHGNAGFDPAKWAAQHPEAARSLGVTPPLAPPVTRPSASAPVNQPPTSGLGKSTPTLPVALPPAVPLIREASDPSLIFRRAIGGKGQ